MQPEPRTLRSSQPPFLPRPPRIFLHTLCEVSRLPSGRNTAPPDPGVLLVLSPTGGLVGITRAQTDSHEPDERLLLRIHSTPPFQLHATVVRRGEEEPLWGVHLPVHFSDSTPEERKHLIDFLREQTQVPAKKNATRPRRSLQNKRRRRVRLYLAAVGLGLLLLLALHTIGTWFRPAPPPTPPLRHTGHAATPSPGVPGSPTFHDRQPPADAAHPRQPGATLPATYESLTPEQRVWLHNHFSAEELLHLHKLHQEMPKGDGSH